MFAAWWVDFRDATVRTLRSTESLTPFLYICWSAQEKGCSIAEFLAIDDEEFQHKRLVRYYRRVGFKVVKYVGDDVQNIPDRLIWGGCGTLMKEDVDVLIQKWANTLALMKERTSSS